MVVPHSFVKKVREFAEAEAQKAGFLGEGQELRVVITSVNKGRGHQPIKTDDPITEEVWKAVMAVPFKDERMTALLKTLHKRNNTPLPKKEAAAIIGKPIFAGTDREYFNRKFLEEGVNVRMYWSGNRNSFGHSEIKNSIFLAIIR